MDISIFLCIKGKLVLLVTSLFQFTGVKRVLHALEQVSHQMWLSLGTLMIV